MYNFCPYCGMKIKDVEETSDSFFIIKFAKHICPDGSVHYFKDDMQFEEFISYSKTIETTAEEYYAFKRKLELKLRKALSDAALKARAKKSATSDYMTMLMKSLKICIKDYLKADLRNFDKTPMYVIYLAYLYK